MVILRLSLCTILWAKNIGSTFEVRSDSSREISSMSRGERERERERESQTDDCTFSLRLAEKGIKFHSLASKECKYNCDTDDAESFDWSNSANISQETKEYIGIIIGRLQRQSEKQGGLRVFEDIDI